MMNYNNLRSKCLWAFLCSSSMFFGCSSDPVESNLADSSVLSESSSVGESKSENPAKLSATGDDLGFRFCPDIDDTLFGESISGEGTSLYSCTAATRLSNDDFNAKRSAFLQRCSAVNGLAVSSDPRYNEPMGINECAYIGLTYVGTSAYYHAFHQSYSCCSTEKKSGER